MGGIPYLIGGGGETNGVKDLGHYRDVILDTSNASLIHDIYFTEYAFPLRGARFAERFGSNVALANIEIRFVNCNEVFYMKKTKCIIKILFKYWHS